MNNSWLGGLLDIIMAIGVLVSIGYVKRAFSRSLLGDAYQVQSYSENQSEFYASQTARSCLMKLKSREQLAESQGGSLMQLQQITRSQDLKIKLTSTEDSLSSEELENNEREQGKSEQQEKQENSNQAQVKRSNSRNRRRTDTFLGNNESPISSLLSSQNTYGKQNNLHGDSSFSQAAQDIQTEKLETPTLVVPLKLDKRVRISSLNIPQIALTKSRSQAITPAENKTKQKNEIEIQDEGGFELDAYHMEQFVKENTKKHYISEKPKPQQLYFLYKLIMNRKKFKYALSDRLLIMIGTIFRCCKRRCPGRYSLAEKQAMLYKRGRNKLKVDMDIVRLIQRNQMNDVNRQVLFNEQERFLLQFQRRNVIDSNSDSNQENFNYNQTHYWKYLFQKKRQGEFEQRVRDLFQEMQTERQTNQMRRILLGVETKCHQQLEALQDRNEFIRKIRRQQTQGTSNPKQKPPIHDQKQSSKSVTTAETKPVKKNEFVSTLPPIKLPPIKRNKTICSQRTAKLKVQVGLKNENHQGEKHQVDQAVAESRQIEMLRSMPASGSSLLIKETIDEESKKEYSSSSCSDDKQEAEMLQIRTIE